MNFLLNLTFFVVLVTTTSAQNKTSSSSDAKTSINYNPLLDYHPHLPANTRSRSFLSSSSFDISQDQMENMFNDAVMDLVNQGPQDLHYWDDLFSYMMPQDNSSSPAVNETSDADIISFLTQISSSNSKIKRRQLPSNILFQMPPASPLSVTQFHPSLQSSPTARQIATAAQIGLVVSQRLASKGQIGSDATLTPAEQVATASVRAPNQFCPFKAVQNCDVMNKFSRPDGSCNNIEAPWMGKTETPFKRLLPPVYADGLGTPRALSRTGRPLPNPRVVSRTLFNENFQTEKSYTHLIGLFGQFLAHDITSASVSTDSSGKAVDCPCESTNTGACASVRMPSNENIMRMSCMKFTRSSAAFPTFDCQLGGREQLNLLSSFIDATQIYGPSVQRNLELRTMFGGQLKTSTGTTARPHLVQAIDNTCRDTNDRIKCFAAGEGRVNENLGLTGIQTLYMREHNRIATELARINPQWNDERLFQETRRIVIALLQQTVYMEWLPTVIGWNTAGAFDLVPLTTGKYYGGYDRTVNPQLANEFAAGAFRFGHTLIKNTLSRVNSNNQVTGAVNLQDIIFRPVEAYNAPAGGIDSIFLGLFNEPASKFDTSFADTLQNHLFEFRLSDNSVIAIDLPATNINRGRDHGIQGYNSYRAHCGFKRATTFQDLSDFITQDKIKLISSVYEHPDDIDLYVGGLSESPASGAVVGPTFGCLLGLQFRDLKKGDRFYYENGPSPTAFSLNQLKEIKKVSMSRIICNNYDVSMIQGNAFMQSTSAGNQKISCSWLAQMDLSAFRE